MRRTNNSSKKNLRFDYDAMGNRIAKHIYTDNQFTAVEKSTCYVRDASGNVMAVYDRIINETEETGGFALSERHIYGSSRIGMDVTTYEFISTTYTATDEATRELGYKQYEISNHLGNVLSVITDQKLPVEDAGVIVSYSAVVITATDYSPFGVGLYGRSWSEGYRYGFQGQEVESGITGERTHTSAEFWMYDARLGRRWEIDPMFEEFLSSSGYSVNFNSALAFKDPDGDCPWCAFFDYAFQFASNLMDGKDIYNSFIGDVDFLSVGANLIPGGKALFKGIKLLSDFVEITPNDGPEIKDASSIVCDKVASRTAGKIRQGLEKMSSNKTLRKVEQRMAKSQNNLKKANDKLKNKPNSLRIKAKVLKSEIKLKESTRIYEDTKKINEAFGKFDDSQWDQMEKVMEKSIEESLPEIKPKIIQCPEF